MAYSDKSGYIGTWKNKKLYCIEKCEYNVFVEACKIKNELDKVILIITDDDMKMVFQGDIIGWLNDNGHVTTARTIKKYQNKAEEYFEKKAKRNEEMTNSNNSIYNSVYANNYDSVYATSDTFKSVYSPISLS